MVINIIKCISSPKLFDSIRLGTINWNPNITVFHFWQISTLAWKIIFLFKKYFLYEARDYSRLTATSWASIDFATYDTLTSQMHIIYLWRLLIDLVRFNPVCVILASHEWSPSKSLAGRSTNLISLQQPYSHLARTYHVIEKRSLHVHLFICHHSLYMYVWSCPCTFIHKYTHTYIYPHNHNLYLCTYSRTPNIYTHAYIHP